MTYAINWEEGEHGSITQDGKRRMLLCIWTIDDYMLKAFFTFYSNRIAFIKNQHEKIIGIISYAEFIKGLSESKYFINKNFKKIFPCRLLCRSWKVFLETNHKSIPILDKKEQLCRQQKLEKH